MSTTRQAAAKKYQGNDESIVYTLTTTSWGSSPTSVEVKAYDITGGNRTDVSDTVLTGSASTADDVITLPAVGGLTANHMYRIEVKFTSGGNVYEPYFEIEAEY